MCEQRRLSDRDRTTLQIFVTTVNVATMGLTAAASVSDRSSAPEAVEMAGPLLSIRVSEDPSKLSRTAPRLPSATHHYEPDTDPEAKKNAVHLPPLLEPD